MLQWDIVYTLARTFPESIVVIWSSLILLGIKIDKFDILKIGILFGVIVSGIRVLPINFGIHTILSMIVLGLILFNISKHKLIQAMLATCQIWIALALSEAIYIIIATRILSIKIEKLTANEGLYGAIITLPSLLILILIVLLFRLVKNKIDKVMIRG